MICTVPRCTSSKSCIIMHHYTPTYQSVRSGLVQKTGSQTHKHSCKNEVTLKRAYTSSELQILRILFSHCYYYPVLFSLSHRHYHICSCSVFLFFFFILIFDHISRKISILDTFLALLDFSFYVTEWSTWPTVSWGISQELWFIHLIEDYEELYDTTTDRKSIGSAVFYEKDKSLQQKNAIKDVCKI